MSTRRQVLSHDVSLEEIFPRARPWRTLYSIHVLTSHLHECNKLGVADKSFILHGAKILSDLLLDSSRPTNGEILLKCLPSLVGFLQGENKQLQMSTSLRVANDPSERPQNSPPPPYIEESTRLGIRLFEIIEQIETVAPITPVASSQSAPFPMRAELMKLAYSVILQLSRTDDLWPEIEGTSVFVDGHRRLLLNEEGNVSQTMSAVMIEFAKEKRELATPSYLNTLMVLLPDAMSLHCYTAGFFTLFREVLMIDRRASDTDGSIRSIIDKLVKHVWQYEHTETADNAVVDPTLLNLLSLLNSAIDVLKSFKQPLALGSLAVDIYDRLLFCDESQLLESDPSTKDTDDSSKHSLALRASPHNADIADTLPEPSPVTSQPSCLDQDVPKPLYNGNSRAICMDIVRKLCDSTEALAWLVDRLIGVTQRAAQCPVGAFPTGNYIRAPEASSGLTNLGMTCYMNSLLQQIYSNIQFRKFVFDTPVADSSESDLLWHVKRLFAEMQDSNFPCVDTQTLAKFLNISVDTQEDVHGFYTIFMSALEQCLSPAATATFNSMFSGKLVTQVQGSCGHVSSRTEPFSDLSITVQNKTSLADSLDEFVQGEPMQGANKYKCLSCDAESGGKLVDAMRRTCLDTVPDHLTVCLKRFTFDMMGQESKNNDFFQFPEEIDLAKYKRDSLENPDKPAQSDMFKLVGVIVHAGILTFGHYWSYVRLRYPDPRVSRWARLEDSMYRPAKGFEEVRSECFGGSKGTHNGYVLFYQRSSAFETAASTTLTLNAQLGYNMPPRVKIPTDLYHQIHKGNVERYRTAQPFDDGFHRLVVEVMHEFRVRKTNALEDSASPQSPDMSSPGDDQLAMPDKLQSYASLARLALNYITHVLLSEQVPPKLLSFVTAFKNLAVTDTTIARCFIEGICSDPEVLLRVVDHDDADSRTHVKVLLKDCLLILKSHDQDSYFGVFTQFVTAHASLLSQMGPRYQRWFDYFAMAYEMKLIGDDEASMVLNAGYVTWILETAIDVPINPSMHQDQQVLWNATRKGKATYQPLIHFVQLFLMQSGAFETPDSLNHFARDRKFGAARALVTLPELSDFTALGWMVVASMTDGDSLAWEQHFSAVLVHAMAKSPDQRFRAILHRSLIACFHNNTDYKPPLYMMATAFIIACGDHLPGLVHSLIGAMVDGIKQFERMPCKMGLEVLSAAMQFAPLSTLRTIDLWAPEWLLPINRSPKRTQSWLTLYIFSQDPLTKVSEEPEVWGNAVDVARSRSVRALYDGCNDFLLNAHDIDENGVYPQMQAALVDAYTYLGRLITMCNQINLQAGRLRQLADRGAVDVEDEAAEVELPSLNDIPALSRQMDEECEAANLARQRIYSLLQNLRSWEDEQEQVAEEVDSSEFDDTEEDEV
jgi:ubiquitin carboxyl-terminal hydrolase 34